MRGALVPNFLPSGRTWTVEGVNERMRFLRYHPGQEFKPHLDGHFKRMSGPKAGDCSFITLQLYLNQGGVGSLGSCTGSGMTLGRSKLHTSAPFLMSPSQLEAVCVSPPWWIEITSPPSINQSMSVQAMVGAPPGSLGAMDGATWVAWTFMGRYLRLRTLFAHSLHPGSPS